MKVTTTLYVEGREVISSGSMVVYIDNKVSVFLESDKESLEVEFQLRFIEEGEHQGIESTIAPSARFLDPKLSIVMKLRKTFGGVSTTKSVPIGSYAGRRLFIDFSSDVPGDKTVVLFYTLSLGEKDSGQA